MRFAHVLALILICLSFPALALAETQFPAWNKCPELTPSPFQSVFLIGPEHASCARAAEIGEALSSVNRILPADLPAPSAALVLMEYGNNALFDGYAIHLPAMMVRKMIRDPSAKVPASAYRSAVTHEYGHAVFMEAFLSQPGPMQDFARVIQEAGKVKTEFRLLQIEAQSRIETAKEAYYRNRGGKEGMTEDELLEVEEIEDGIVNQYRARMLALSQEMRRFEKRFDADQTLIDFELPLNELFADLVAALASDDWQTMAKAVAALHDPNEEGLADKTLPRDFTFDGNEKLLATPDEDTHIKLAASRFALWKRVQSQACAALNKGSLLRLVLDVTRDLLQDWNAAGREEWTAERTNLSFSASLDRRLANGAKICLPQ